MSIGSLTYQQSVHKRYHGDKHLSEVLPTRWRHKSTGLDMEQNYITLTLCIQLNKSIKCHWKKTQPPKQSVKHKTWKNRRNTFRCIRVLLTVRLRRQPTCWRRRRRRLPGDRASSGRQSRRTTTLHNSSKPIRFQRVYLNLSTTCIMPMGHKNRENTRLLLSHARTVVRECCKGDDESQRERGKFDPLPPKNPLTDGHQNLCRLLRRDIYHHAKFYPNRFRGFGSAHAWFRDPKVTRLFFWFLRKATAETRAPILTQNTSNDAVPRKEVPIGGRETKI